MPVHLANADPPMWVTVEGRTALSSIPHPMNYPSPMYTAFPKPTVVRLSHPLKTKSPMCTGLLPKPTVSSFSHWKN